MAELRPASIEAFRRGTTRERLVRQISRGEVAGVNLDGKWYVKVRPEAPNELTPQVVVRDTRQGTK